VKESKGCIYELRCKIGSKKGYVGQHGSPDPNKRWDGHIRMMEWGSQHAIHRALRKYGVENFTGEVIWCGPISKLNKMETRFIKKLNTLVPDGYNMTLGGEGTRGWKPSAETRLKISLAQMGKKHTSEACENMRRAQLGRKHSEATLKKMSASQKGHPVSDSVRKRLSLLNTGLVKGPHTDEHKARISKALKGREFTPAWRAKLSAAKRGKAAWNKGKKTGHAPANKGKKFIGGHYL